MSLVEEGCIACEKPLSGHIFVSKQGDLFCDDACHVTNQQHLRLLDLVSSTLKAIEESEKAHLYAPGKLEALVAALETVTQVHPQVHSLRNRFLEEMGSPGEKS